jgi:predicted NBD/HSP70 family sugar kinase/fructoselysine-6-P-deglycase FrlB-like protein
VFATIDMGGTSWKLALMECGHPVAFAEMPNTQSEHDLGRLPQAFQTLCGDAGRTLSDIASVGVSIAEFVDAGTGICLPPGDTHTYLENTDLSERIARILGKPAAVDNDARCALLGELHSGVAVDCAAKSVVMVTLGTGIGVAISMGGSIHNGARHSAATAFGHVQLDPNGPICHCGRRGCAEALISGWAIGQRLRERSGFADSTLAHVERPDFHQLCEAVRLGDVFARTALHDIVQTYAAMLAILIQVVEPDVMLLSGGFMLSADLFIEPLRGATLAKLWRSQSMPQIRVVREPKLSALRGAEILAARVAAATPPYSTQSQEEHMPSLQTFGSGYAPAIIGLRAQMDGAAAVLAECARQHRDALETVSVNAMLSGPVADRIRAEGQVMLLGMGASHFANQIAASRMRSLGVDAVALPASEALYSPRPYRGPVILTTQSGGSVEIHKWIEANGLDQVAAGITLNSDRPFGDAPTLIGAGGVERAFAATRSFSLTLAAFSTLILAMGGDPAVDGIGTNEPTVDSTIDAQIARLAEKDAFIVAGRASFEGVAAMTALGLAELGRLPAFALEGGQMRHGPVEMFSPEKAVILFRSAGASASAWSGILDACERADTRPLVFDASGEEPWSNTDTIRCQPGPGISAIYDLLPSQQALTLGLGAVHVPDVGTPAFSAKITRTE